MERNEGEGKEMNERKRGCTLPVPHMKLHSFPACGRLSHAEQAKHVHQQHKK